MQMGVAGEIWKVPEAFALSCVHLITLFASPRHDTHIMAVMRIAGYLIKG